MISLARLIDFLLDPRMPQYLPYVKLKQLRRSKPAETDVSRDSPVLVALTFDIEYDFGSSAKEATFGAVEPFLQRLPSFAKDSGAVFTLFIQSDLVARFARYFQELQAGHELGLHGYAHELWGSAKWFLPHHPTSVNMRRELLEQSLKCFADNNLIRPTSFRAPDLVADQDTLRLLEEHGFIVDSSAPSYYGVAPAPTRLLGVTSNLLSIPITVNPDPCFQTRYFVPFTFYEVFNMARLATSDDSHFIKYVGKVLAFQVTAGVSPHLVFLAHPWEFKEWTDKRRPSYCSSHNYDLLNRKFSLLEERYQLRYVSMKELSRSVSLE